MDRLCERPGCSERASVACGMRPEDLVFWLDHLPDSVDEVGGVLCRRHADSMVVPRGWTLDDLRDPELHLFRPPQPLAPPHRGQRPRPAPRRAVPEVAQLELGTEVLEPVEPDAPAPAATVDDAGPADVGPWTPDFDEADDLDGLLSARSPLLARAFKTADRAGR